MTGMAGVSEDLGSGVTTACPETVFQWGQTESNDLLSGSKKSCQTFQVCLCAVDIPRCQTVCQDTLNEAEVKGSEQLSRQVVYKGLP